MKNIFQGNLLIQKCIAEALGFDLDDNDRDLYFGRFTEKFYFEAFFYLSNRFGQPINNDDYKIAGVWSFKCKDFVIEMSFRSSNIEIVIYGEKWYYFGGSSPYMVKQRKEYLKNSDKIVSIGNIGEPSEKEKVILEKVMREYLDYKGLSDKEEEELTNEDFNGLFDYANDYNSKILNVNMKDYEMYDQNYSNAYTRTALRTLTQLLHNLLTPVWVRDCPFNLLGRGGQEFEKYHDNIEIECTNKS